DIAAGARLVFDHDRLTEPLRQPRRHDPRHDVGAAAGRKADDPAQPPRRVGLRAGATRSGWKGAGGAREMEKSTAGKMHGASLSGRPGGVVLLLYQLRAGDGFEIFIIDFFAGGRGDRGRIEESP